MKSHNLAIKRLMKEYQNLIAKPVKSILAIPCPDNIFEWHFILYDLDLPYLGGFYHGKLLFPTEYPTKPPNLIFLTPTGRFKPQEKICLSFTGYHPESWSISWNVENMLIGLISFMYTEEHTTGGIITSTNEKKRLATESLAFNLGKPEFAKIFGTSFKKLGINPEEVQIRKFSDSRETDNEGVENIKKMMFWVVSLLLFAGLYIFLKGKWPEVDKKF